MGLTISEDGKERQKIQHTECKNPYTEPELAAQARQYAMQRKPGLTKAVSSETAL
jgi:hypothetical protein